LPTVSTSTSIATSATSTAASATVHYCLSLLLVFCHSFSITRSGIDWDSSEVFRDHAYSPRIYPLDTLLLLGIHTTSPANIELTLYNE
jgi:hypothetical protein